MSALRHDCPKCGGAGQVELSDHLRRVLALLPATVEMLARFERTNATAMNNRCAALVRLGFARRVRDGKRFVYHREELRT